MVEHLDVLKTEGFHGGMTYAMHRLLASSGWPFAAAYIRFTANSPNSGVNAGCGIFISLS